MAEFQRERLAHYMRLLKMITDPLTIDAVRTEIERLTADLGQEPEPVTMAPPET